MTRHSRLFDLDNRGIDIQVVARPRASAIIRSTPKFAEAAHRLANEGVWKIARAQARPVRRAGVVTLQEPENRG